MIAPIYVDMRIRFETADDLRWFLKQSEYGSISEVGMELAVGYYLNKCREHKKEYGEYKEEHCCIMDSGCIYSRLIK